MSEEELYPSARARSNPDALAYKICDTGERVTYGELEYRSNQVAHLFRSCGLVVGDHVVVLMENNRHFLEICFGAERAGLYYTTVSTRLTTTEVAHIVDDCGARALITSAMLGPAAAQLRTRVRGVEHFFIVGEAASGFRSFDACVEGLPGAPIADEAQGLDMLYSSGTTGRPKGVKWPMPDGKPGQRTMLVDLLGKLYGYGEGTRYLSPAPLYHAAPLRHSMTVLKLGGTVFIMQSFDAERALALIEAERINCAQWVPTMFVRMLKLGEAIRSRYDVSSLHTVLHAAAPCPVAVKEQMLDWWGPIIHEYYAGTENNGFCSIGPDEWRTHPGSVGRAILGELHICDDGGEELPVGEPGTVYFANGHQFEYHNDPQKTSASRNHHGWTTLGDVGRVDDEGYLYLLDRKAFVIISGGVNVYPQEAEDALLAHPEVVDAAVFGVPNDEFGEEVKAVVQPRDMAGADSRLSEVLIAHCRETLAGYKCPRSIDFEAELPRHPTGKLYKRLLKARYWPSS